MNGALHITFQHTTLTTLFHSTWGDHLEYISLTFLFHACNLTGSWSDYLQYIALMTLYHKTWKVYIVLFVPTRFCVYQQIENCVGVAHCVRTYINKHIKTLPHGPHQTTWPSSIP